MVFVIHCYSIVPVWIAEEIYTFIWKKGVRFILYFYAGRECAGISLMQIFISEEPTIQ